jgi:hypothetical protein
MPKEVGTVRFSFAQVLLALVSCVSTASWAACTDTFPESQVVQRLAKEEYASCSYEAMSTDQSKILKEQARLLETLRPAYQRRLVKDFTKQALQVRLDEFDAGLREIPVLANAIVGAAPIPGKGGAAKGGAGADPSLQSLLKREKQNSDTLRSRIALAKDGLDSEEESAYCKLDFQFRLGDGLNAKMRKCFK